MVRKQKVVFDFEAKNALHQAYEYIKKDSFRYWLMSHRAESFNSERLKDTLNRSANQYKYEFRL